MISVTMALENNRDIFVAPYPQGSETMNNKLINEGAILADTGRQILDEVDWE